MFVGIGVGRVQSSRPEGRESKDTVVLAQLTGLIKYFRDYCPLLSSVRFLFEKLFHAPTPGSDVGARAIDELALSEVVLV